MKPIVRETKFITAGLSKVGNDMLLIKKSTIHHALPSFIGCPLFVEHIDKYKEDATEVHEDKAVGYVVNARFDAYDGWFYCELLITNDDVIMAVLQDKVISFSCSYDVIDLKNGGKYNGVPYTKEITDLEFTSIAIVPQGRYEEAKINGGKEWA